MEKRSTTMKILPKLNFSKKEGAAFDTPYMSYKHTVTFTTSASLFRAAWLFSYQLQSLLFIFVTRTYIKGCNGSLEII